MKRFLHIRQPTPSKGSSRRSLHTPAPIEEPVDGPEDKTLSNALDAKSIWLTFTRWKPKTPAEKYAEAELPAGDAPSELKRSFGVQTEPSDEEAKDALTVNLNAAQSLITIEPTIRNRDKGGEEEAKLKKEGCSVDVENALSNCCQKLRTEPKGYLKGVRRSVPRKLHVIQYFRKQLSSRIHKKKNAIVVDGNNDLKVTYQELDEFSNSIAYNLRHIKFSEKFEILNPNNELVIAVSLPACYEYVVILLSVLKLGAAILPLAFDLPVERIVEIIKLTRPVLTIITKQENATYSDAFKIVPFDLIHVDDIWSMLSGDEDIQKKSILPFKDPIQSPDKKNPFPPMWKRAVAISVVPSDKTELQAISYDSRAFLNRIDWENFYFAFLLSENCIMQPNSDSVQFIADTLTQLCIGVTLIALQSPIDYYIPDALFVYCNLYKVKRLTLFPALLKACSVCLQLFEDFAQNLTSVRYWFCTGGCMTTEMAEMFFEVAPPTAQLIHMYVHEDCLSALTFQIYETVASTSSQNFFSRLPVGSPAPNTHLYLLDENLKPVPDGEDGEIYVTGLQLPRIQSLGDFENMYYFKNPFSNNKDRKHMIRTFDFGHITKKSNGVRILIHDHTRVRHYYVENQIVWLLHIDRYLNRLTNLVKSFRTLCYRPNEDDQVILAFCVMTSNGVKARQVEDELAYCLPSTMIPEVVPIPQIPMMVDGTTPDENELLTKYRKLRASRKLYEGWGSLGVTDPNKLHATKVLTYVIFTYVGVSVKELAEIYWNQPFLNIRRATVTKGAFIVKELHKSRYPIYMDDFMYASTLEEIVDEMVRARKERGFFNRECPPDEILITKNRYKLEIMVSSTRSAVCSLLAKCFTTRGQLDYYAQVNYPAMRKYFDVTWPIFVSKRISILVRRKKGKNRLVGAVLNMNWNDELQLRSRIPPNIGYKLELIEYLESGLTESHFHQDKTQVFQICYLCLDETILTNAEIHGITDKIIRSLLVLAKVKQFDTVIIVTYDFFTWDICVNKYGFKSSKDVQVNQFIASDGTRPYALCPDSMVATMLWRQLGNVQDVPKHARHLGLPKLLKISEGTTPNQKKPWSDED